MKFSSLLPLVLVALPFEKATTQCRPGKETNEAKLLAFYAAPLAFSTLIPGDRGAQRSVKLVGEVEPIPKPDHGIQKTDACFTSKTENTSLAPAFGRVRLVVTLPFGLLLEGSYLPPVTIADATPNLVSASIAKAFLLPGKLDNLNLSFRVHSVRGTVKGPITCPRQSLQATSSNSPCFGSKASRDTFRPNLVGVEASLARWSDDKTNSFFVGVGENWIKPRFQVGFTSGTGAVDSTRIEVDLTRAVVFGGYNRKIGGRFDATAEVYSVPSDVTLFRGALAYRLF